MINNIDLYPTVSSSVRVKYFDLYDIGIAYNTETDQVWHINKSLYLVLEQCNGLHSLNKIVQTLQDSFGNSQDELKSAVVKTIDDLVANKLIDELRTPQGNPTFLFNDRSKFPINSLLLELTSECNFNCVYCYNRKDTGSLNAEEVRNLVDDAVQNLGILSVTISGGEPFLRPDIFTIIEYIKNRGCQVVVLSNASLITREDVKRLGKMSVHQAGISCDALDETIFNKMTQTKGFYPHVLNVIDWFLEEGIKVKINTVIAKGYNDFIENIISLQKYCKKIGAVELAFRDILPEHREQLKLIPAPENLRKIYGLDFHKESEKQDFKNQYVQELDIDISKLPLNSFKHCGIGSAGVTVKSDGFVLTCPSMRDFRIGNIRKNKLSEICNGAEHLDLINSLTYENIDKCRKCKQNKTCKGGCRARAYLYFNDLYREDPVSCSLYGIT